MESESDISPPSKNCFGKILIILTGLAVFLLGALTGYFFGVRKAEKHTLPETPKTVSSEVETPDEKTQIKKLLSDAIKIRSYWISPDKNYVIALLGKDVPEEYPSDMEYGFLYVDVDLVIINRNKKQTEEINLKKLIGDRFDDVYKNAPIQFSLRTHHLGWLKNSEEYWGLIEIHSSADPSLPVDMIAFRIDIANRVIDTYSINLAGAYNYFKPEAFNPETGLLLAEVINQDLFLYLYDIPNKSKETIVSYPREVLVDYFGEDYLSARYFYILFRPDFEKRQLEPKWIDDTTFSYLDFETREEVVKTIK